MNKLPRSKRDFGEYRQNRIPNPQNFRGDKERYMINILFLNSNKARKFLLRHESYCNFDLPPYFKFGPILNDISTILQRKNLSDFYLKTKKPWDFEDVNYKLTSNKDGKYAWRPLQLIHPALYVSLVHTITETRNWNILKSRFSFLFKQHFN